jgi:Cu(I)/Ag(I) efflux system membrane fusion protein
MHPQIIRDIPGDCPICGMFLIELVDQDLNSYDSSLTDVVMSVNESVLGLVKSVSPEFDTLPIVIEAHGIINYDPRKVRTVSAHFGGHIEKTFVKYQFQYIKKGQKIYEIYSPDIYYQRWNYVQIIQAYPDRDDLTWEALEWFRLLGLSKGQVDSLKRTEKPDYYLPVYCNADGYAISNDFDPETFFIEGFIEGNDPASFIAGTGSLGFNEGITVETGAPLFKLIDVASLRIDLRVKTEYGPLLKTGQKVLFTDTAYPDRKYEGTIGQIDPLRGGLFQTVRVYLIDTERALLPGRKIEAQIIAGSRQGMWVPATAVIDLGQRRSVFVLEHNKYVAREVRTGVRISDKIEILYGVDQNSLVAEKAMLLVDSDGFIKAY